MKNLKLLFTALLLLCATAVAAHDFEVDGIYYNILSETDKTVEVTFKGTSYSEYSNEYSGSVVIPSTVSVVSASDMTVIETFDAWTSTNKGNGGTTSQKSYTLNVAAGNILKFDWSVSSESNYDWLIITLDGTEIVKKSGTLSGSYEKAFDTAGSHTLVVKYTKDGSVNNGNDEGKIYNVTLNGILGTEQVQYRITSIGWSAFNRCSSLTSIEIPNSVTSIAGCAFYDCTSLTSIEIPNNVTSIGYKAFYNCTGLTSVEFNAENCTYVGDYSAAAFYGCTALSTVTIGENVKTIPYYAFKDCTGLTSVVIPNSVTCIGDEAFEGCTGLTSVVIPNSVTSIGDDAFCSCRGLTSITIPNSVTSIGNRAFSSCSGLRSIYVATGNVKYDSRDNCNAIIETITNTLVAGCKNTIIPNSVTGIGEYAFSGCTGLTNVEIPNSVTSIENYAFSGCSGLTSVEIPSSVTSIGYSAFEYCTGLTSIEIPSNIINLGTGVFRGCRFKTITIGAGVKDYCAALNEAYAEEIHITDLTSLFESNTHEGSWLHDAKLFLNGELITELVVPDGVTRIPNFLLYDCSTITSVVIPNSVTSIGDYAFYNCSGLTGIEIPNSVTSIGLSAFSRCSGLRSVTIGSSVKYIGGSAFNVGTGIRSITSLIPAEELFVINENSIGYHEAFSVVNSGYILYVPYGAKETYASTSGWDRFANIVELEPTATEVTVTINQYGNATYCSPYALDFSNVEGLKAYAATGYNKATQVVTLTRVQTAEAGVGLFLKGEPGEYTVPVIEYSNDYTLNLLVGTLEETVVNSTTGEMSNYKFTIADGDAEPMFYPFVDGTAFSAGKAYLQIPTAWLSSTASKAINIRFDEGETTDIDELKGENGEVKTIYDLQGRVVENPTSGIYIIDGKKVIIK